MYHLITLRDIRYYELGCMSKLLFTQTKFNINLQQTNHIGLQSENSVRMFFCMFQCVRMEDWSFVHVCPLTSSRLSLPNYEIFDKVCLYITLLLIIKKYKLVVFLIIHSILANVKTVDLSFLYVIKNTSIGNKCVIWYQIPQYSAISSFILSYS